MTTPTARDEGQDDIDTRADAERHEWHQQQDQERIADLEAQLAAAREEIREFVQKESSWMDMHASQGMEILSLKSKLEALARPRGEGHQLESQPPKEKP